MKYMRYFTWLVLILSLLGCTDYDGSLKKQLQSEYDRMNETGNQAYCYLVGHVNFPYIDGPPLAESKIPSELLRYYSVNQKNLASRLPFFADVGLLNRERVSDDSPYYRYSLTKEGEEALYFETGKYASGLYKELYDSSYFCYGRRVVLKVTDIVDQRAARGEYMFTEIVYDLQIEDVPKWAMDERLLEIFDLYSLDQGNKTYPGSARVMKKGNSYYNDGGMGRERYGQY